MRHKSHGIHTRDTHKKQISIGIRRNRVLHLNVLSERMRISCPRHSQQGMRLNEVLRIPSAAPESFGRCDHIGQSSPQARRRCGITMQCHIGHASCVQGLELKSLGLLSSQGGGRRVGKLRVSLPSPGPRRFVHHRLVYQCQSSNGSTYTEESRTSTSDQKLERLRKWLKTLNHDDCNLKLERCAQGSSGSGYRAFAGPGGVANGTVIVKVPREALMTETTARQCQYIGPLVKKGNLTPWQAMCLHLLYERARGEASTPTLQFFPQNLNSLKMRREWLEGSPMLEVTERRLAICREDHEAMLLAGAERLVPRGHGSEPISITETAVQWAATILLSRSFSLNLQKQKKRVGSFVEETVALVPWADILNHSSAAGRESCLIYDQRSGVATLQAHCPYSQGQQVFDSYGPNCSPSRLLLDYEFVDEENTNHAVDLPASELGPVNSKANELLLEAMGLPSDGAVFSLTSAGVDDSVLVWTRAAVATKQELYDAGWREGVRERAAGYPSAATVMFRFSRPINRDNESEVLRRLLSTCDYLLQKYPTTYEQDGDMLATPGAKVIPRGRKQALKALMSEKVSLTSSPGEHSEDYKQTTFRLFFGLPVSVNSVGYVAVTPVTSSSCNVTAVSQGSDNLKCEVLKSTGPFN